jgi:beta-glucanase (GH16 family)
LTFDDEFDGATLDTSKWNVNQYQLPYEMSESLAKNVSLRNSDLVIPAIRETGPHGRPWTSAYIDTRGGKFAQKYGRFEARIKINTTADNSSGLWPAFWLRPDNTAYTGEIDIMEAWGEKSTGYTTQVYPAGGAFTSLLADTNHADNRKQTVTLRPAAGTRLSDGFHTYALEWTPTTMAVYLDNVQVGPTLNPTSMPWWNNYDTAFHIRLQMQVGQLKYSYPDLTPGYWGTPTSSTISYSEMLVDWVRVWGQ